MLIYNHDKELIGIDKESLTLLGYENFETLIKEHGDVAEMFVKKPGYIHNFTNFPWIDFVLHAESEDAKVIIAGKTKAFSASLDISTMFLKSFPEEEAFIVRLKNIHNYQLDASERPEPTPEPFTPSPQEFNAPAHKGPEVPTPPPVTPFPEIEEPEPIVFEHQDMFLDEEEANPSLLEDTASYSKPEPDDDMEIFFQEDEPEPEEQRVETNPEIPEGPESIFDNIVEDDENVTPMLGSYLSEKDKTYLADLEFTDEYVYNPQIAADELGLPVDLIEEFIGDFIKQAHEFKDQLFTAMKEEDFDNIKILSHKLKGVAANLRIEDAFEVLRTINETSNIEECEANLKGFYITVGKLEGKDIQEVEKELDATTNDELYDLTPKFETPSIEIEDTPLVEESLVVEPLIDVEEDSSIDFSDLEEPSIILDDTIASHDEPLLEPIEEEPPKDDDDALYDFGLLTENSDDAMIVLEDEEEIINDLNNFDIGIDDDSLSDIKDLDEIESAALDNAPVLNFSIDTAANEIGLSADLVGALIEDYIEEANEMKSKLVDVIESNDLMRWKGYATQLKGVSDNLRIHEISDALQHLIESTETNQAKAAMHEFYGFINQL